MYLGSIMEVNCDDLGDYPIAAPVLHGNEEEIYQILRLPHYPRSPALYEASITDEELHATYVATEKHKSIAVDNMYARLSKAFHHLHDEYGDELEKMPVSPLLTLQRLHLQIISGYITLFNSNLLPFRFSHRGVPEFINIQTHSIGAPTTKPRQIPIEILDESDDEAPSYGHPPHPSGFDTTVGMGGVDRTRRPPGVRPPDIQREDGYRTFRVSALDEQKIIRGLGVTGRFKGDRTDKNTMTDFLYKFSIL